MITTRRFSDKEAYVEALLIKDTINTWGNGSLSTPLKLTYSFMLDLNKFPETHLKNRSIHTDGQLPLRKNVRNLFGLSRALCEYGFQQWKNIANIELVESNTNPQMTLLSANNLPPSMGGYVYHEFNGTESFFENSTNRQLNYLKSAFMVLNQNFVTNYFNKDYPVVTWTIIHEEGHLWNKLHPFISQRNLPFISTFSSLNYDLLEYQAKRNIFGIRRPISQEYIPITPMYYDIAAAHVLYGPSSHAVGNDVHYIDENMVHLNQLVENYIPYYPSESYIGSPERKIRTIETIYDPFGEDTISAERVDEVVINLNSGPYYRIIRKSGHY